MINRTLPSWTAALRFRAVARMCCSAAVALGAMLPAPGSAQDVLPGAWPRTDTVYRLGWWAASRDGDDLKVGEFQDLSSSPFWDVDAIFSDGRSTLDLTGTGLDNEGNSGSLHYFRRSFTADVEYDRFIRRWEHDRLNGGSPESGERVLSEDLNVGEDYAIRVQQLKANFQGRLTENIRWKLKVWGLRKSGERQANAFAHAFDPNFTARPANCASCHVSSQKQSIDWLTMEIEPSVEASFDHANIEYSRTMRSFGTSDAQVTRTYNHFGPFGGRGDFQTRFPFAMVPDSFTQVDRLSVGADLTEHTYFYGYLYHGNTRNQYRETDRRFNGFDFRIIHRPWETVTVTTYGKLLNEDNELPPFLLPEEQDPSVREQIRHPINYLRARAGLTGRWRPFGRSLSRWQGFSVRGGYEFYEISRSFARFEVENAGDFVQPDTISHQFEVAPQMRWSPDVQTFVRYRARFIETPLAGVHHVSGDSGTALPELESLVEMGGTWTPLPNFLTSVQVGIENRLHKSNIANFEEDNYPLIWTLWFAPTPKLSLTGGYALYTNWIDQDIRLGFRDPAEPFPAETLRFRYGGRAAVVNLGGRYAWTERLTFNGGIEWVRGRNLFSVPASNTGADWSLLSDVTGVVVETMRYNGGVDCRLTECLACFFRYNYFDYEDMSQGPGSGTAHFFLAGADATY